MSRGAPEISLNFQIGIAPFRSGLCTFTCARALSAEQVRSPMGRSCECWQPPSSFHSLASQPPSSASLFGAGCKASEGTEPPCLLSLSCFAAPLAAKQEKRGTGQEMEQATLPLTPAVFSPSCWMRGSVADPGLPASAALQQGPQREDTAAVERGGTPKGDLKNSPR